MKYIWMISVWLQILSPVFLLLFATYKSFSLTRNRGNIIWQKKNVQKLPVLLISLFTALYFIFMLISVPHILSFIYTVFFLVFALTLLDQIIVGYMQGVYTNGVLSPKGSYKWEAIEKVIFLEGIVRFIHKNMGAFDLEVEDQKAMEIQSFIKEKFPNYL